MACSNENSGKALGFSGGGLKLFGWGADIEMMGENTLHHGDVFAQFERTLISQALRFKGLVRL